MEYLEIFTFEKKTKEKTTYLKLIDLYDFVYDKVSEYSLNNLGRSQYPLMVGTLESDTIVHEVETNVT